MGLIMWLWHLLGSANPLLYGALTYLLLSLLLRRNLSRSHRKGIVQTRLEEYGAAIPHFQASYAFFSRNAWIDRYRFVTLLSASGMSYREMALNNIAFCYGQIGQGQLCREYYEKTLREFPDNSMAKTSLRLLDAVAEEE